MAKKSDKPFHQQLLKQLITLSTTGFGLAAALAWNETIQGFVNQFIEPRVPGSGLISKLIYALIITLFAVLITYQLSKISTHLSRK